MNNEVLSYIDMCQREGLSLQKGMNFGCGGDHSVILMSVRPNAPYHDQIIDDGRTLIYEGHDISRSIHGPSPKSVDQPEKSTSGRFTENGKFHQAAQTAKAGTRQPEKVRVYEKIRAGIWSYNGVFNLVDSWRQKSGRRSVFKFRLEAVDEPEERDISARKSVEHRRIIPTPVKLEVWKRDGGKCVECGSKDHLHFDHILPFSKGGTSISARNVQLLCMRHNLEKSAKIK